MKWLTHWLSPVQGNAPQTVMECCQRARAATPSGWTPRVLLPVVYGGFWQADPSLRNTCGMEIRPKDAPDLKWVYDRFAEQAMAVGAWAVPRELSYEEGAAHGAAAAVGGLFVLDLEPYAGFLVENNRCPAEYIRGYQSACKVRPWVSVVPQRSGVEALGTAWSHWAQFAVGIRPQCYQSDSPALDVSIALPYLRSQLAKISVARSIVPILPNRTIGGGRTEEIITASRASLDLWVLG